VSRQAGGGPATAPSRHPAATIIDLPLVGAVDPGSLSLPMLTLVLAGLDAFNPCAFFVLLFLLSMMAHQKSRARMLAIGGVFVTISGLMYFAFMATWLNVFQLFGHLAWVTLAAGALAVFVGAVNVKDFFWFEKGLTLSIPESKKPDIFRRTRAILAADRLPAMLAATVVLAIAANFYELLCTAGFPMVYTRLLTLAEIFPGRALRLSRCLQRGLCAAARGHCRRAFAGTLGARKAQRARRPPAETDVGPHDAGPRRIAAAGARAGQPGRDRLRPDGGRGPCHRNRRPGHPEVLNRHMDRRA
jgi:hypothetical protein